ncbi:MAG: PIN domain nuclease [Chloroflexi bacterium]|nr:PIN domain nuclease [Chloroflexota bacterium]
MVIVDTTVWIDYLRDAKTPATAWLEIEMDRQRLGLTDLILCEVLQGVRDARQFAAVRDNLLNFAVFSAGGTELAIQAAQNYRALRIRGYTVRRTIDCLIATFCLMNNHDLLHSDRDFDPFERGLGLRVVRP